MDALKSIRIELDFVDESGKRTKKEQTIKVNTPSLKDKSRTVWHYHVGSVYTLSFTLQVPDFIHSYLMGKSVPSTRSEQTKDYNKDNFAKSINAMSIEDLTEKWCLLISDYVWSKKMERADLKKVIFYQFSNKINNYKSYWNGIEFGELSELGYKYAIGYVSETDGTHLRYNSQRLSISSGHDREFYALKYVEWSEERELFFVGVQKSFESIVEHIDRFESSISEEAINGLIAGGWKQLTSGNLAQQQ